jgi:hypothetical protein
LIVAARQSGSGFERRVDRRSAGTAFAFESGAAAVALDVHLEDGGVVDEAVDDGERHRLIGEDLAPFAEWLVGGDQQGSPLVSGTDEFEQDAGFGLILGDIGEVVEDQRWYLSSLAGGDSTSGANSITMDRRKPRCKHARRRFAGGVPER